MMRAGADADCSGASGPDPPASAGDRKAPYRSVQPGGGRRHGDRSKDVVRPSRRIDHPVPHPDVGTIFLLRHAGDRRLLHARSEEHTSELQSLMRISYAVFCLKKKNISIKHNTHNMTHTIQLR